MKKAGLLAVLLVFVLIFTACDSGNEGQSNISSSASDVSNSIPSSNAKSLEFLQKNGINKQYSEITEDDYGDIYYSDSQKIYFRFTGSPNLSPVLFICDRNTLNVTPIKYDVSLTDEFFFIGNDKNTLYFSSWEDSELRSIEV